MNRKVKNERGQGLVEYILIAVFVGIAVAGGLMAFGPEIKSIAEALMGSSGYSIDNGVLIVPGLGPHSYPIPIRHLARFYPSRIHSHCIADGNFDANGNSRLYAGQRSGAK